MAAGVGGVLHDKTPPLRIPPLPTAVVGMVVMRMLGAPAPDPVTHWTEAGAAHGQRVQRQLATADLEVARPAPHQVRRFKLPTDPNSATKVDAIGRRHVDPPAHAGAANRREKPDPGTRRDPARPGGTMTHHCRAQRHYHAVRGISMCSVVSSSPMHATAPAPGVIRFLNVVARAEPPGR
jgi:hypothetical protein